MTLTLLYGTVFALTDQISSHIDRWLWALCNAAPHVLLMIPLVYQVGPLLARLALPRAAAAWLAATLVYSSVAYGSAIFLLALTARIEPEGIWVRFFQGPALSWQIFQSTTYAALAITVGMLIQARRELSSLPREKLVSPKPQTWLVKTAEGIVPIDPNDLIRVEAYGEYVRLVLSGRTFMARVSLTDCADRLKGLAFLRVHRSHLVNGAAIVRAESAGNGRLQLALRNGDSVITSREGARLIRAAAL